MTTLLTLGAGALLADFIPTATTAAELRSEVIDAIKHKVFAETTGAGKFRAIPLVRNFHEAARRTPAADATLLDGWNVSLASHFKRLQPNVLEKLLPWCQCNQVGDITTISIPNATNGVETTPSLFWVGETSGGLALIELKNAAVTNGLTLTFIPGEGIPVPFELRAHADDLNAPFTIRFLEK